MRIFKTLIVSWVLALGLNTYAQKDRNVAEYNLSETGTGLISITNGEAYDPVGYFPEGGSKAQKGKAEFALDYKGVEYLFANAQNMKTFLTDPEKYEPTYGGYCARAMVVGQKVEINAELFIINGRRIHFFVNNRAKRFFERNLEANEAQADSHWKTISGEAPRL